MYQAICRTSWRKNELIQLPGSLMVTTIISVSVRLEKPFVDFRLYKDGEAEIKK